MRYLSAESRCTARRSLSVASPEVSCKEYDYGEELQSADDHQTAHEQLEKLMEHGIIPCDSRFAEGRSRIRHYRQGSGDCGVYVKTLE